jgi:hypothetical protein
MSTQYPHKMIKAHGLEWTVYKTAQGLWRYIGPKSNSDKGPFKTLKALRESIREFGANINWQ